MHQTVIKAEGEPLLKISTRELLSIIIGCHEALSAKCGPLSNAPSDILEALDKADDAVREAREWLSEAYERPCMSRREWTGEADYPRAL